MNNERRLLSPWSVVFVVWMSILSVPQLDKGALVLICFHFASNEMEKIWRIFIFDLVMRRQVGCESRVTGGDSRVGVFSKHNIEYFSLIKILEDLVWRPRLVIETLM